MKKVILGIIIGTLFSGIGVYAATTYLASDVTYKDTTVEAALDDLYTKQSLSDTSEYLNNYKASNYKCSTCGGTATLPTLTTTNNTVNIKWTSAVTSQGIVYQKISDISKYKYIFLNFKGNVKSLRYSLIKEIKNNYEESNLLKSNLLVGYSEYLKNCDTNGYIDVSDLSGEYYLIIDGTYVNVNVITKGILK